MTENTVVQLAGRDAIDDPLTQLLREGARRLIEQAGEAELQDLLARHADRRTEDGRAGVVRESTQSWQGSPAEIEVTRPEGTAGTGHRRWRDGMLHMMFKLGQCAEKKWRRLRGFDYLAKVITGVKFKDRIEVTDIDQKAA